MTQLLDGLMAMDEFIWSPPVLSLFVAYATACVLQGARRFMR